MTTRRVGILATASLIALCALSGCGAPNAGVAQKVSPGIPEGLVLPPMAEGPAAAWIDRGKTFAIITWGSGSCPPVATALDAVGENVLAATFGPSPNDPCTADMSPTTHEFDLPEGVTGESVVIEVSYEDWSGTDTLVLE